jgi:hypothetical protein
MYDQMFDSYRKASESWLQMQQDLLKNVVRQPLGGSAADGGPAADWARNVQKRGTELAVEILNRQRESIEALYRSVINLLERSSQVSEAKSPEDYRRASEDLWKKWVETVTSQSETQLRDIQNLAGLSLEIARGAQA